MSLPGIFQNAHIKPFPIRAAIDIGTNGAVTLAVGRVDARQRAIQRLLHHQQVAVPLQYAVGTKDVISEGTVHSLRSAMRQLSGVMRRADLRGITEVTALLTPPLSWCVNAQSVADEMEKEFKSEIRVFGRRRDKTTAGLRPLAEDAQLQRSSSEEDQYLFGRLTFNAAAAAAKCTARHRMLCVEEAEVGGIITLRGWDHTEVLATPVDTNSKNHVTLDRHHHDGEGGRREHGGAAVPSSGQGEGSPSSGLLCMSEEEFLNRCMQKRSNHNEGGDDGEGGGSLCESNGDEEPDLLQHTLPITTREAHQFLLSSIQRRTMYCAAMNNDTSALLRVSPNPVLREEWVQLVRLCESMIRATLPQWVMDKRSGVVCGASTNGGVLNIAARVSQQQVSSLYHLETHAEHHLCGLTDVLLASNFPSPSLVLTQAALGAALMRALDASRIHYLPEISIALGLLVAPELWAHDRAAQLRESLEKRRWFRDPKQRVFDRPRSKTFKGQVSGDPLKPLRPMSYGDERLTSV